MHFERNLFNRIFVKIIFKKDEKVQDAIFMHKILGNYLVITYSLRCLLLQ